MHKIGAPQCPEMNALEQRVTVLTSLAKTLTEKLANTKLEQDYTHLHPDDRIRVQACVEQIDSHITQLQEATTVALMPEGECADCVILKAQVAELRAQLAERSGQAEPPISRPVDPA